MLVEDHFKKLCTSPQLYENIEEGIMSSAESKSQKSAMPYKFYNKALESTNNEWKLIWTQDVCWYQLRKYTTWGRTSVLQRERPTRLKKGFRIFHKNCIIPMINMGKKHTNISGFWT